MSPHRTLKHRIATRDRALRRLSIASTLLLAGAVGSTGYLVTTMATQTTSSASTGTTTPASTGSASTPTTTPATTPTTTPTTTPATTPTTVPTYTTPTNPTPTYQQPQSSSGGS